MIQKTYKEWGKTSLKILKEMEPASPLYRLELARLLISKVIFLRFVYLLLQQT